jgi:glycosyltransferase involved in cell wall biosynthesis
MMGSLDYAPNVDATLYFHQEIFPLVREQIDCRLLVVGRHPPESIRALAMDPHVEIHGNVPNVLPYYKQAMVSVVALRAGGGTRLKILEAMATGTPVISTTIGCEGLDVTSEKEILLADEPEAFASQVVKAMSDETGWEGLSRAGRKRVETSYDWKALSSQLEKVYMEYISKQDGSQG